MGYCHANSFPMIKQKSGSVVTISSVIGRKGDPHEPGYGACKAAQINLTHSLAAEMSKHGIRLNIVALALTMPENQDEVGSDSLWSPNVKGALSAEDKENFRREFESKTPMGKIAKPVDVAHAVLFFASDVMFLFPLTNADRHTYSTRGTLGYGHGSLSFARC